MTAPYVEEIRVKLFDLSEDIALVIGGTGVLGGGLAEGLAMAGAKVVIVGRNAERGEKRAHQIRQEGGKAVFIAADAQSRENLQAVLDEVLKAFGTPTVLVNAAGGNDPKVTVVGDKKFESITLEDWQANYQLNLVGGALLPCQVFGPAMVANGVGSIINIASVSAHLPLSRVVSYSSSKAAVLSLSMFLAREWAKSGVRVNTITPGFFPAEQNRRLLFNEDGSPTPRAQQILSHTPMARFGSDQELVGAAVFLACRYASGFITGSDIRVDGGFLSQTI